MLRLLLICLGLAGGGMAGAFVEGRAPAAPESASPAAPEPASQAAVWPGALWAVSTPAAEGLRAAPFEALDGAIRDGVYGHVDRMLVIRHGRVVVNHRYPQDYAAISRGRQSALGCGEGCADPAWLHEFNYFHPRWHPFYEGREIHTLQSVTKSIAATVVGIALARGAIKTLRQPFLEFFADRTPPAIDPRLRTATVEDLLTMRSGIEWHEQDRPLGETNTTVQLEKSADWIRFTLAQPMDAAPGTKWTYNSGGSMLLSGIVRSATGRFIDDYAREFLFAPIGIRDFHWKKTPTGHPDTEGGLYLSAEDLARLGYLYLRGGRWNGRDVLQPGWVQQATTRHVVAASPGWDYGYQWWLTRRGAHDVWAARGFGGQFLVVVPSLDLVGVTSAWNVFGERAESLQNPFLDAIVAAASPSGGAGPGPRAGRN